MSNSGSASQSQPKVIRKNVKNLNPIPNLQDYDKTYRDFSWKEAEKELDYFEDGTMNAAYNAVDRHAQGKRKDKIALLFKGADEKQEQYTFRDLKKLTNKFANVLTDLGVQKGDRVFIFLPPIP